MVFMGTYVAYGKGKAVVTATGMNTQFGKVAEIVQEIQKEEIPIKVKLDNFARNLA